MAEAGRGVTGKTVALPVSVEATMVDSAPWVMTTRRGREEIFLEAESLRAISEMSLVCRARDVSG